MKVISTNIGDRTSITHKGDQVDTGIFKYPVQQALKLELTDVVGDTVIDRRYHGGEDKACYLYSTDHYKLWKSFYPELDWQWGMFGENLSVKGLEESVLFIGDIFRLGTALVQISQPRQPCFKLGIRLKNPKAVKQFVEMEKPGAYVRVLEKGEVSVGDTFKLVDQKQTSFSLQQIFHLIYNASDNISEVNRAIDIPELAESCRNDLRKYAKL